MGLEKIRIGMIGAGAIGNVHMEVFSHIEGAEIAAVTDVYLPLAQQRAQEHGIKKVHESPQALLEDDQIDAVIIGVPNKFHAELAIAALQQGKHLLLEKPMAINAEEARLIVEAAKASGKILMMSHQMRWTPLSRAVKAMIDNGDLGHIYNAKAGWLRKKGIPGWGSWFTRMEQSGGGPLIDIGVHMLDLSQYLMGSPKPISVYGSTYSEFGPQRRGIGSWGTPDWNGFYDVEDLASALIKMDNGATLSLEVSWAAHAAGLPEAPFIYLMGTKGGISIVGKQATFETYEGDEVITKEIEPQEGDDERYLMARHFVACIREGKEPITSGLSGYTNNRILDAIYESSRTGDAIKLAW